MDWIVRRLQPEHRRHRDALDRIYNASQELGRLYSYASLLADQDTRISANQGLRQEMVQLAAAFSAATS